MKQTVFVVDNDDVVYDCEPVRQFAIPELTKILRELGITATPELWNELSLKHKTGFHPLMVSREYGIPFRKVVEQSLLSYKGEFKSFVTAGELKSLGQVVLFTENSLLHANRVLRELNLSDCFEYVLGLETFGFIAKKDSYPQVDSLIKSIYGNDVQIAFIDDSAKNLRAVPDKLNWRTVLFLTSPYAQTKATDFDRKEFPTVFSLSMLDSFPWAQILGF